jgi:hypothetical protein
MQQNKRGALAPEVCFSGIFRENQRFSAACEDRSIPVSGLERQSGAQIVLTFDVRRKSPCLSRIHASGNGKFGATQWPAG